jgi:hypothetical protein
MSVMFANKEVASRHLPIAHGRDDKRDAKADSARDGASSGLRARRGSETRLQVAVVLERKNDDDADLYADVPCTD